MPPNVGLRSFPFIIYLFWVGNAKKKIDTRFAQHRIDNRMTKKYGLSHKILCIKFFRAIIKIISTRVLQEIKDIIIDSLIHTVA